jgi:geranylgeranyl diphosphate synthase type II
MVSGQADDIRGEYGADDGDLFLGMYGRKTGALITASVTAGAVISGNHNLTDVESAAAKLGLAFQIRDDILDVTGNKADMGKPVNSDSKNKKNTYVSVFGLKKAEMDFIRASAEAADGFSRIFGETSFMSWLIARITDRTN